MINRREFLSGAASLTAYSSLSSLAKAGTEKPNIVFFLVDDCGWGDFGCYGDTFHETRNIDQLAREGMRFTNAYAAAPVCSPSRAGIMTGQCPARLHLTQWIPGSLYPNQQLLEPPTPKHLSLDIPTLAEQLKALGYQTGAVGKWHLGGDGYLPENFGFDFNVAGDNHGHPGAPNHYFGPFFYHNLTGYTNKDYLTQVLTTKAEQFIRQAAQKGPFFLYMAEYAVHMPLEAKQRLIQKYQKKNGGKSEPDPVYAAMVEYVDIALGQLRDLLDSLGVLNNTIIVVTSDNGGVVFQGRRLHHIADNGPLRAGKGFLYEGGIREPLIVHWPGVTKAGTVCDIPVSGLDFLPTLLSMIGAKDPIAPQDGMDISPLFRGSQSIDRNTLYWHYPHYSDQGGTPSGAIRERDWKLIEFFEDNHVELYDLALDPGEQYNLAFSFGDKAEDLREKLHAWRRSVNALMPMRNPEYNQQWANLREGPAGCSWDPSNGCLED
ncbi:MAG: sulfatase [Acidobacteriota bacterium]